MNVGNLDVVENEKELNNFLDNTFKEANEVAKNTFTYGADIQIAICNKKEEIYKVIYINNLEHWLLLTESLYNDLISVLYSSSICRSSFLFNLICSNFSIFSCSIWFM